MSDTSEKRKVTLYLPPDLHRGLKIAAAEEDRTISEILEEVVTAYLENRKRPKQS